MNDIAKNILLWLVIAFVLMSVFTSFGPQLAKEPPWMMVGLAVLVIAAAAAEWRRLRLYRQRAL